jgi:hypothetical protein
MKLASHALNYGGEVSIPSIVASDIEDMHFTGWTKPLLQSSFELNLSRATYTVYQAWWLTVVVAVGSIPYSMGVAHPLGPISHPPHPNFSATRKVWLVGILIELGRIRHCSWGDSGVSMILFRSNALLKAFPVGLVDVSEVPVGFDVCLSKLAAIDTTGRWENVVDALLIYAGRSKDVLLKRASCPNANSPIMTSDMKFLFRLLIAFATITRASALLSGCKLQVQGASSVEGRS